MGEGFIYFYMRILLYISLFLSLLAHSTPKECSVKILEEMVAGKKVKVTELSNIKSNSSLVSRKNIFGTNEDIVVAIDNNGHTYDNIYDARHDGHHFQPAFSKKAREKKRYGKVRLRKNTVEFGNYFKFENISKETKDELYAYLKSLEGKDLKQTSCIRSTCKVLEKGAGIKVKGRLPWLPSAIFKKIINDGFVDRNGNPVEYSIYRVEGITLEQTLNRLKEREAEKLSNLKKALKKNKIIPGAIILVIVSGVVKEIVIEN